MRTGKVKESILKRSVLRQLHNDSILTPGKTGADHTRSVWAAEGSHRAGVPTLLINPVEGWTLAAERAVYGAVNSYAAAGLELRAIAVTILMPEGTEESQLKALIKNLDRLCRDQGIVIASGHTAVSPAVNTLVLSVAGIGQRQPAAGMGQRQSAAGIGQRQSEAGYERTEIEGQGPAAGNKKEGTPDVPEAADYANCDIVMAGTAAGEGAALLALAGEEDLLSRYAASYIETAGHLYDHASMKDAAGILRECSALSMRAVREGGVFGGLWELAVACKVGLDVDLKSVPIRQHTIEVCEYFDLNPYMLISGGCLLAVCPSGAAAVEALRQREVEAAVIGRTTDGNDRIIRYDTERRYLEPPKMDEIYKVSGLFGK